MPIDLLGHRLVTHLVVALDNVDVIAKGGDLRQADPAFARRGLFIQHRAPFPGLGVVGHQLHVVRGVVLPLALHGHPQGIPHHGHALEAIARLDRHQLGRQADFLVDLAIGTDVIQRMGDHPVGAAFRGDPEAALAVGGDAFHVQFLRRHPGPRHPQRIGDPRRFLARIDGEDRRLAAIEAVVHGKQRRALARRQARNRAPARQLIHPGRSQVRIHRAAIAIFEDHHMRPGATILAQVGLVGRDQQVARRGW